MIEPPPAPSSPEQDPPDAELVQRAQQGDPSAFDDLVRRYQKRLYSVIHNMTHHHADTEDILYETFQKAYQNIHGFKAQSGFHTWLYRIAINRSLNFIRSRKNKIHISLNDDESDTAPPLEIQDETAAQDPEQQLALQELQNKLNESLQKLSEEHRAVVNLFDIQGLSHAEIAKIMDCSEGTVRSRLFYAHKQLQKSLKSYINQD